MILIYKNIQNTIRAGLIFLFKSLHTYAIQIFKCFDFRFIWNCRKLAPHISFNSPLTKVSKLKELYMFEKSTYFEMHLENLGDDTSITFSQQELGGIHVKSFMSVQLSLSALRFSVYKREISLCPNISVCVVNKSAAYSTHSIRKIFVIYNCGTLLLITAKWLEHTYKLTLVLIWL